MAGFGRTAMALEKATYRDSRSAGILHVAVLVGGAAGLGVAATQVARRGGWAGEAAGTAAATWAVLGGTSLGRTGST